MTTKIIITGPSEKHPQHMFITVQNGRSTKRIKIHEDAAHTLAYKLLAAGQNTEESILNGR